MLIGLLQTGEAPPELKDRFGDYNDMFVHLLEKQPQHLEFKVFRVLDNEFPSDAEQCDGWLITGSRYSAYEDKEWIHRLKKFVRQIAQTQRPLVGICFGHQLIAEALGGRVEKSDKGWGLGLDTYQLVDGQPRDTSETLRLNIFHKDQIVELPANAKIFAHSDFCEYAGLLIGEHIMTIQAHPEFSNDFNVQLLQARKTSVLPADQADVAIGQLQQCDAQAGSQRFASRMARFLSDG